MKRKMKGQEVPNRSVKKLFFSFHFLNFLLNVLPHMTVEFKLKFAEGTTEDGPFLQLNQRVIGLTGTDRTGEGYFLIRHVFLIHCR
jgi:hypothetical protein